MSAHETGAATPGYALSFDVDYPDRPLDRVSSAFRIFTVIPIAIVLSTLGAISSTPRPRSSSTSGSSSSTRTPGTASTAGCRS